MTRRKKRVIGVAAAVAMAAGCLAGCDSTSGGGFTFISPDGSTVVRRWWTGSYTNPAATLWLWGVNVESEYLEWFRTDEPTRLRRALLYRSAALVGVLSPKEHWEDEEPQQTRFAPDSRHVAALSTFRLVVVNLNTGKTRQIAHIGRPSRRRAKQFVSMTWLGNDEICYALQTAPMKNDHAVRFKWTLFRQNVEERGSKPRVILEVEGEPTGQVWTAFRFDSVHWSPNGRYALFAWPHPRGRLVLVDVLAGRKHVIWRQRASLGDVAWRADGSAAFCPLGEGGSRAWVLVDTLRRKAVDPTQQAEMPAPRMGLPAWLDLAPLWTADGQFVVGNSTDGEAYLIRPSPWKIIRLNDLVQKHLGTRQELEVRAEPCALAGWIKVTGAGGAHLMDYRGQHFVEIPLRAIVSRTGTQVVRWRDYPDERLEIRPLALPQAAEEDPGSRNSKPPRRVEKGSAYDEPRERRTR